MTMNDEILKHVGLIKKLASKITKKTALFEELVQEGLLGLVEAASRFNPNSGSKFLSYGGICAHGKMKQYIRDNIAKHDLCDGEDQLVEPVSFSLDNKIIKDDILEKVEEYLNNTKDYKKDSFTSVYLGHIDIDTTAKKYSVSPWAIRQHAAAVKKDLIKYINQGE